jgi:hypothetical protein
VLNNGHRNQRFRLILLEGTETRSIHTGWLSNTLQYLFPRDFSALCVRLFGEGNNGGMLATNETISNEK